MYMKRHKGITAPAVEVTQLGNFFNPMLSIQDFKKELLKNFGRKRKIKILKNWKTVKTKILKVTNPNISSSTSSLLICWQSPMQ